MFYVEENNKIVLFDEDRTKLENTLEFMPQYQHLDILETDRPIINFEFADTEEYKQKQIQARKEKFDKEFFKTSSGYIKRTVTNKYGLSVDFLTQVKPILSVGASIIAYYLPDFTQEIDMTKYQKTIVVSESFLKECDNQSLIDIYDFSSDEEINS